jgi:hypothetical protein
MRADSAPHGHIKCEQFDPTTSAAKEDAETGKTDPDA